MNKTETQSEITSTSVNDNNIADLTRKIDVIQKTTLPQMSNKIIQALLSVFEQISFIEETEDIKAFINSKIDDIKSSLDENYKNTNDELVLNVDNKIKQILLTSENIQENLNEVKEKDINLEQNLQNLTEHIETIQQASLPQISDKIIQSLLNIFEQISFIEEAEDIKAFIDTKIDDIKYSLGQNPDNPNRYSYTLEDVESDIAKLRLILEKINEDSPNSKITEICENINKIDIAIEKLQTVITQEQLIEFQSDFGKLNEEILSISSRTNQMLLNSDEIQENLQNIQNRLLSVENANSDHKTQAENILQKADNILETAKQNIQNEQSTQKALTYLGEWIDSTGNELNKINDITDSLNTIEAKCPDKIKLVELLADKFAEQQDRFAKLEKCFTEQQENFDRLEKKLDTISSVISEIDDTKIIKKIDKIEKKISQLTDNIEKLASYVD